MCIVLLGILIIPIEASLGTAFYVFIEISLDATILQERVNVDIVFI